MSDSEVTKPKLTVTGTLDNMNMNTNHEHKWHERLVVANCESEF